MKRRRWLRSGPRCLLSAVDMPEDVSVICSWPGGFLRRPLPPARPAGQCLGPGLSLSVPGADERADSPCGLHSVAWPGALGATACARSGAECGLGPPRSPEERSGVAPLSGGHHLLGPDGPTTSLRCVGPAVLGFGCGG